MLNICKNCHYFYCFLCLILLLLLLLFLFSRSDMKRKKENIQMKNTIESSDFQLSSSNARIIPFACLVERLPESLGGDSEVGPAVVWSVMLDCVIVRWFLMPSTMSSSTSCLSQSYWKWVDFSAWLISLPERIMLRIRVEYDVQKEEHLALSIMFWSHSCSCSYAYLNGLNALNVAFTYISLFHSFPALLFPVCAHSH